MASQRELLYIIKDSGPDLRGDGGRPKTIHNSSDRDTYNLHYLGASVKAERSRERRCSMSKKATRWLRLAIHFARLLVNLFG